MRGLNPSIAVAVDVKIALTHKSQDTRCKFSCKIVRNKNFLGVSLDAKIVASNIAKVKLDSTSATVNCMQCCKKKLHRVSGPLFALLPAFSCAVFVVYVFFLTTFFFDQVIWKKQNNVAN